MYYNTELEAEWRKHPTVRNEDGSYSFTCLLSLPKGRQWLSVRAASVTEASRYIKANYPGAGYTIRW